MSRHDPRLALRHMHDHAVECLQLIEGASREDLLTDRKLYLAVLKLLEIIGEAATRVPREQRDALPAIPWPQIIRMRNHLIHAYENVNHHIVWNTVHDDLPPLIRALRDLVGEDPRP